jgi:hypothetical protein
MKTALVLLFSILIASAAENSAFEFSQSATRLSITRAGNPVADYVFKDAKILRPHFANLRTPDNLQATRQHPPVAGQDPVDHDTMHPGLWLAFGDINGADFWRNQGTVEHVRFSTPPAMRDGKFTFTAENRLLTKEGKLVCHQTSRLSLANVQGGYLFIWEAAFKSDDGDIIFGDQEEMGLGVRVATPITEKNGGTILSSTGQTSAKATWGKLADWCDYSGTINGHHVGITLMPDPKNFRPSWFHNRDYGVFVANAFGRKAMKQGEKSAVTVKRGETFQLRYGVWIHSSKTNSTPDITSIYKHFAGN